MKSKVLPVVDIPSVAEGVENEEESSLSIEVPTNPDENSNAPIVHTPFDTKPVHKHRRRGTRERKEILASCTSMSFEELSEKNMSPFSPKFAELLQRHHSGHFDSNLDMLYVNGYVIDPSATWKVYWDIFVGLNILYSAIVVPFRLGFHVEPSATWVMAEVAVDVTFFVDMIFSFFTAYEENGEKVVTAPQVARHYLRTWFLFDLISTVPFYLIGGNDLKTLKLVRMFRLFRLLKLIRLVRLNQKLSNAKASGHITLAFYELSMVIISVLFLSHLFSCLFYVFTVCDGAEPDDGYTYEQCGTLDNEYSQYLLSLHWTLATVLKVGYGDVVLTTPSGRLYSVGVMLMGSIISGYILAVMLKQAETANPIITEKSRRMAEIGIYLRQKEIPRKLMQRLGKHFEYYYSQLSTLQEPQDMSTTAPALRLELFHIMRSDVVKMKLFNQDFHVFSELQKHLQPYLAESGELIMEEGDYCIDMFFVIHGLVHGKKITKQTSVVSDESTTMVGMWTDSGHFGIATAMLMERNSWATYVSRSVTDMVWIDLSSIEVSPETAAILTKSAKAEVSNHAVVQSQLKNVRIDPDGSCHTPLMIQNDKVISSEQSEAPGLIGRGISTRSNKSGSSGKSRPNLLKKSISTRSKSSKFRPNGKTNPFNSDNDTIVSEELTHRVVRLTGAVVNGQREYEITLETTWDMLSRGVINPHWQAKMFWDLFVILCTVIAIFTLPIRFGFNIRDTTAWRVYDIIIEVAFLVDMALGFITAYERPDFLLNTEHKFIAWNYFKGWFACDFIAGFPFALLVSDGQISLLKLFKVFRVVRIMRILKILKVSRLLKVLKVANGSGSKFTMPFSTFENVTMKFIRGFLVVAVVAHFGACGWGKLDRIRKDGQDWTNEYNSPIAGDLFSEYTAALYWAVATATGTGYGDIVAQNDGERLFGLLYMVGGVCTMVYFVGQVAETQDEAQENRNQRVDVVRAYLSEQALPESLKAAVLKHFSYSASVRSEFHEVKIWSRMPFSLRLKVALQAHRGILTKFPVMFPENEKSLCYILLKYLEPSFVVGGSYVYNFETGSAGIYLLLSGEGEIVDEAENKEEEILGSIIEGQKFGLEAFRHEAITFLGIRAVHDMSMYVMTVSSFDNMVTENPLSSDIIVKNLTTGASTASLGHLAGNVDVRRKMFKRSDKYGPVEHALYHAYEWIIENEENDSSELTHLRCLRSHSVCEDPEKNEAEISDLLDAINKNSPSLSLSFEGRQKFIEMKKQIWKKKNFIDPIAEGLTGEGSKESEEGEMADFHENF